MSLGSSHARAHEIATQDTILRVEPRENGIAIVSLRCNGATSDWIAHDAAPLTIDFINHVQLRDKTIPLRWKLPAAPPSGDGRRLVFRFTSDQPPLELESIWKAYPGPGPIEHTLRLTNRGSEPILVPLQPSLALTSVGQVEGRSLRTWWVEKGGGTPTPVGIHESSIGAGSSALLKSGPLAATEPRDPIPFVAVRDVKGDSGWYAGIEFSGRVMMRLKSRETDSGRVIDADFGLEPKPDMLSLVPPNGVYQPPVTFIGCFRGDMDDCGNDFRRWVAEHLRPPVGDPHYPLLVNNSWGSGMAVDEKLAKSMIDQSAALGLEMFHIDAGWFRAVGNWRPNPAKFPGGLRPISDYAHAKGLKFGLWVGWTQAGNAQSIDDPAHVLSVRDPSRIDWFTENYPPDWKPQDFSGATVCLADPRAEQWCLNLLRDLVKENRLDMLEHDQRMIVDNCSRTDHAHTKARVDIAFRAGEAYYRIYDALRKENPNLLFEDCVNGGQMVDFGVIRRVHYISITDTYDPLSNRRAFYDASYVIPPAMCECYVDQHPGKSDANFLYMLRSGMMGWCTIMLDTKQWTPEQHELARRQFELYRTRLRPLINSADLHHVSDRPDGVKWDGIEYFDRHTNTGVLFAFRGTTDELRHAFKLRGLDPRMIYEISYEDGGAKPVVAAGTDLTTMGLTVELTEPQSSQLVFIRGTERAPANRR